MNEKRIASLALIALITALPFGSLRAASSASYEIDPADDVFSSGATVSSGSYEITGSLGDAGGLTTSASYALESSLQTGASCGDGFVDPGEDCDSGDLDGGTCVTQGFDSGTLACSSTCTYDTSACENDDGGGGGGGGGGGVGGGSTSTSSTPTLGEGLTEEGMVSFDGTITLYGRMQTGHTIMVNDDAFDDITYPTSTTWRADISLNLGVNYLYIVAVSPGGIESNALLVIVTYSLVGDVNGDFSIDDYDLSLLVNAWGEDELFADFNEDNIVDDYDFSLFVSRWSEQG